MQTNHIFLIDSDSAAHRLSLDGYGVGTFTTLTAAEQKATRIAQLFAPKATPDFAIDFKWTLSDCEIRAAVLACPNR